MYRCLLLLGSGLMLLTGCQEHVNKESSTMSQNVSIKVGEQGTVFAKRYPGLVKLQHQPAGLIFYEVDLDADPRGIVTIEHGTHSFTIEDVIAISGPYDHNFPNEGISEFDVYAGMSVPSPGLIPHDEARQKMHVILQRILQAGWKMFIDRDNPRLRGKDALNYVLTVDEYTTLDASYIPSFEEWMRIKSLTKWRFYADHVYLSVDFTREHTLTDPAKPGAYLVSFNLKSENEFYRGYVGGENRKHWKTLLPAELAKLAPVRAETEAKLRAQGIKIDETYQDPPVPDLGGK